MSQNISKSITIYGMLLEFFESKPSDAPQNISKYLKMSQNISNIFKIYENIFKNYQNP